MRSGEFQRYPLLGTAGWQSADWYPSYFPADMPVEWQLAYYANDCDCGLLRPADWRDANAWQHWLAQSPGRPRLFLDLSGQTNTPLPEVADHPIELLIDRSAALPRTDHPVWLRDSPDSWRSERGTLVLWRMSEFRLRELRGRLSGLPDDLHALVLDGPGADPARIRELRVLLDLLGFRFASRSARPAGLD